MTKKLVFNIPGPDEPGFFKRIRRALELQQEMQQNPTPDTVNRAVEFLADYVEAERKQAVELLWEASENQIMDLINTLAGGVEDSPFPIAPANG